MSVTVYPDTAAWLASRSGTLGASEIAAVLGANKHKSAVQVYTAKVDANVEPETRKMRAGKLFERSIAELWAGEFDYELIEPIEIAFGEDQGGTPVWQIDGTPLTCTPDFFAQDEGGRYVVEIKNVTPELRAIPTAQGGWKEGPPLHYIVQVQAQMMVLRANGVPFDHAILVAYFGGDDVRPFEIEPDPELWKEMQQVAVEFWNTSVLRLNPPPADKYTSSADMSKAYRKCAVGKLAEIEPSLVIALRDARAQFDVCEKAKDKAEAEFKAQIKDAEPATCGGIIVATWKDKVVNYQPRPASTSTQRPFMFKDKPASAIS